jgi:hypothetical protein
MGNGMPPNAQAPRNGTLRNETTLLFRQPTAPKSRARPVVEGRVFAEAVLCCLFFSQAGTFFTF